MKDIYLFLSAIFYDRPKLAWYFLESCETVEQCFANSEALLSQTRIKKESQQYYVKKINEFNLEFFKSQLDALVINIISYDDEVYPSLLKEIEFPPLILYSYGQKELLQEPKIAVVGPRDMTEYGEQACRFFSSELSPELTIVSGLALGIDAIAHQSALDKFGKTIAVLGCGVDVVYPKKNIELYDEIKQKGLLISEYPPGTQPNQYFFPQRNRIISGLCDAVLIVEASLKSGSLITARMALEQNRDVFAVPGSIFSAQAHGVHKLIQDGAKCVHEVQDIVGDVSIYYDLFKDKKESNKVDGKRDLMFENHNEQRLYDVLSQTPKSIDDLVKESGLFVTDLLPILTQFEFKAIVDVGAGQVYSLKR